MGCGNVVNKPFKIITSKSVSSYDFSFPYEKAAGIGTHLLKEDHFHDINWEKILNRPKLSVIPSEILPSDLKSCSKIRKLMISGPPNNRRWDLWKTFFSVKSFPSYHALPIIQNASSDIILKDLGRTFPNLAYFDKEKFGNYGQNALYRILSKFATQYPKVGYCQGMNYIVGFLLLVSGSREDEVFLLFTRLCEEFNLFDVFSEDMREIKKNLWVFDRIFEKKFNELFFHFNEEEVTNDMWVFKWFLSIFTTCLPINAIVRVWDFIIVKGLKGIYQIALGIVSLLQSELLKSDLAEILVVFNKLAYTEIPVKCIIKAAQRVKIKRHKIERYRKDYETKHGNSFYHTAPAIIITPTIPIKPQLQKENLVIQEITETLDELPPFKKSKSGFNTPSRTPLAHTFKAFDYYTMGRMSFIEERSQNEDEIVNAKQFLDDLVNENATGDSFIIQVCGNNK
ncbi:hypothetical protein SteCoe_30175 [Stentor coeruleus]|uniref:Rab-GAP TBC domain-containing protein n=1 Tax=Stentor coeruleus TaxID=5963 RepID=A0A1R2B485_9CILI|nr:hypothetical protein SteCoe_30175 [Stentor coeruleus]